MELPELSYKNKTDIGYIWLKHMDRVNLAAGMMDGTYEAYVRQQFRLLPAEMREWVMSQSETFTETVDRYVHSKPCGLKIGSPLYPVLKDPKKKVLRYSDGSIDWDDPNILSPHLVREEQIDYEAFNLLILAAAEKAKLSWDMDLMEIDAGDTPEYIEQRKRTPFRPQLEVEEEDE